MSRVLIWSKRGCVLWGIILSGCHSDSIEDLDQFIAQTRAMEHALPALPAVTPAQSYRASAYRVSAEARDPFFPSPALLASVVQQPTAPTANVYLEEISVDTLQVVGALRYADVLWVCVEDDRGRFHKLTVGDSIGRQRAKVVHADARSVSLLQRVTREDGSITEQIVTLQVQEGRE